MKKTYIISEIGLNHNGSITLAKEMIIASKESGADAVKFQKRNVETLATDEILNSKDNRFPEFGNTYGDIRRHLEFSKDEYKDLKKFSENLDLDFFVTAFDTQSVDFLVDVGCSTLKIASHSLTNIELLKYIKGKFDRYFVSTGMGTEEDVKLAIDILKNEKNVTFFHCVSSYPSNDSHSNLSILKSFIKRYPEINWGYSGHEMDWLSSTTAVAIGATAVERHFTTSRELMGFDHKISLEPKMFKSMVDDIRRIEILIGDKTTRELFEYEKGTKNKYHVSMISKRDLKSGEILTENDICWKNPGSGIMPKDSSLVLNKKIKIDILKDTLISTDFVE